MQFTQTKLFEYSVYLVANVVGRLRKWLLGKHAIAVVYDSSNGIIMSGPADLYVGGNLGFRGHYDPETVTLLLSKVTSESRVLVLGTHVGSLVIPLAKKVREVVAYEANPLTFRMLSMNLLLNDVHNCRAYNFAVSDKAGTLDFMTHHVNSGSSKRKPTEDHLIYKIDQPTTISVPSIRLDEHIDNPAFDLVLVDIEGSEYFAFQGMQKIFAACQTLQFEFLPTGLSHIARVTPEEFAAAMGDHFSEYRVEGTNRTAHKGGLAKFLRELYDEGGRVDILATK